MLRWSIARRRAAAAAGAGSANVTVFGQSGGAAKVIALMGMPAAKVCNPRNFALTMPDVQR